MIRLACPTCAKKLMVDDSRAGMVGRCPGCAGKFRVPAAKAPSSSPNNAKASAKPFDELELVDDDAPKTRPAPTSKSAPANLFDGLELLDDSPPPRPSKPARPAAPKEEPADELELIEDEEPAPPRKPARLAPNRDAITRAPEARRKARLAAPEDDIPEVEAVEEVEEVDEDEARRDQRPKKKKKKRRPEAAGGTGGLLITIGVAALLWIVLTPFAFKIKVVAYVMIAVGAVLSILGRGTILRLAREEGGMTHFLVLVVPFYETYFFLTRINKTFIPLVMWVVGVFFLGSGGISMWFHRFDEARASGGRLGFGNGDVDVMEFDIPALPQDVDAKCTLLIARSKQEAGAWLKAERNAFFGDAQTRGIVGREIDQAYQAGAKEVVAANVHRDEDGDVMADIIVVLPDDPAARKKVLDWYHTVRNEGNRQEGKKYILLVDSN